MYTAGAHWLVFCRACSRQEDDDVQTHRKHVSELDRPGCSHTGRVSDLQNAVKHTELGDIFLLRMAVLTVL